MLLPSKLVCHRDRLSQPALMSKIVSVYGARENEKRDVEIISREKDDLWKNGKRRNHAKRERLYRLGGARASEREGERETNVVSSIQHRNENTFCGPIHQIGCGMFRVISQPF